MRGYRSREVWEIIKTYRNEPEGRSVLILPFYEVLWWFGSGCITTVRRNTSLSRGQMIELLFFLSLRLSTRVLVLCVLIQCYWNATVLIFQKALEIKKNVRAIRKKLLGRWLIFHETEAGVGRMVYLRSNWMATRFARLDNSHHLRPNLVKR